MSSNLILATVATCGILYFLYTERKSSVSTASATEENTDERFIVLYVTVPNQEVGAKIAAELVNEKLIELLVLLWVLLLELGECSVKPWENLLLDQ